MCALTQGLTLSHRTERRLCGETVRKLIITLQKVAAQSTCSNARSILSVVRRVLLRYYSAWQRALLCPMPIQGSSSPPGPISSESAHGRDKTWTWWRSHPVTAVLETQGTIKCATSNVIAGSWPITAQRSEPGDQGTRLYPFVRGTMDWINAMRLLAYQERTAQSSPHHQHCAPRRRDLVFRVTSS